MDRKDADSLIDALKVNLSDAELSGRNRIMLNYAIKLSREPQSIVKSDVDGLRSEGFDDVAIHDICAITSYFAFVNRIADGLGVELER